jgi:hypothetical protein
MELSTTPSPTALSSARENDSWPDISFSASYRTMATSRSAFGSTVPYEPTVPCTRSLHSRTARVARRLAAMPTMIPMIPATTPAAAIAIIVTHSTILVTFSYRE